MKERSKAAAGQQRHAVDGASRSRWFLALTGPGLYCDQSMGRLNVENRLAHLEMAQAIVNRMSVNSFLLKGWSVVLVSALFAQVASDSPALFVYLAYFPAVAFWVLDGYFLRQEKLFRRVYDKYGP